MVVSDLIEYLNQIPNPDTTIVVLHEEDYYEEAGDYLALDYVFVDFHPEEAGFEQ